MPTRRPEERGRGDGPPLYVRVREALKQQIQDREWSPGAPLPNEFDLAARFGVSQGTMRKALDLLAQEQLLVRRQGRGTFVAEHTPAEVLFRFFQFRDAAGRRVIPESRTISTRWALATKTEAAKLDIALRDQVIRHVRIRLHEGRPFIYERVVLPEAIFPGLGRGEDLPNTLYDKFQHDYGITVARADEALTTKPAAKTEAARLRIDPGEPLLVIDRQTADLGGRIIEWRLSFCHLGGLRYAVEVG